ncbi:MAG: tripartite tricarboxylate transporter substrate binding protein [bacterium]|nr:tripartite tricarboxylate transporter substrate binding protein [bacterium]
MLAAGCQSAAGPYPSREIKLIVQASPGGLSDTVSRVVASLAEKRLGVPVVCENKPGASGALAFSYVTRQPANGYTIGHAPVEIAMVRTLGFADVGPAEMDLLCLVSKVQPALAVHPDAPWQSFTEFVEAVTAKPGYYVVANSGTGSIWHVNSLLMERAAGLELVHCPFSGSSGALTALLGRHVDAAVAGVGEIAPHVEAGSLRALAIFGEARSDALAGVPAVTEEGHSFGASAWSGFFAPKGLPADAKAALVDALRIAFDSADFQKICKERGMEPAFLDSTDFGAFATEQARFFTATIPELLGGTPQ